MNYLSKLPQTIPFNFDKKRAALSLLLLLVFAVFIGGTIKVLKPTPPVSLNAGQELAHTIANAAQQTAEVQAASGAYIPGSGIYLYTKTDSLGSNTIRIWATRLLGSYSAGFESLPSNEKLVWLIDYGENPVQQEIVQAPLNRSADPTRYEYLSLAQFEMVNAPANETELLEEEQADSLDSLIEGEEGELETAVNDNTSLNGNDQLDFENNLGSWLPISGNWSTVDGTYAQTDTSGFNYLTMLQTDPITDYQLSTDLTMRAGEAGAGIVFNASSINALNDSQVVDFDDAGNFIRWGRFDENGAYVYEGGTAVAKPLNDGTWHNLQLNVTPDETAVIYDGAEVGRFTNPRPNGHIGLISSVSDVAFDNFGINFLGNSTAVSEEALDNIAIEEDFSDEEQIDNVAIEEDFDEEAPIVATSPGIIHQGGGGAPAIYTQTSTNYAFDDPTFLDDWTPFGGEWEITDGELQQLNPNGFDLGITAPFYGNNYILQTRFKHLGGTGGAGIFFNMALKNSKATSQMLNIFQEGSAIQWGSFDENGDFVYTDMANIQNTNDGNWHTLQLTVRDGEASITIDNELVRSNIPLSYSEGYVGLMTSQSHIAFDDFTILTGAGLDESLGEIAQLDTIYDFEEPSLAEWLPFAGIWEWAEGSYEQQQTNEFDRASSLTVQMIAPYTMETKLRFVEGAMESGLIFNMQQRDSKARSQVVSFTANGEFLQWGSFDESGVFQYVGGMPIFSVQDENWHTLQIVVRELAFDIVLDGQTAVSEIPLDYTQGYVGLFTSRGWIAFDDVHLVGAAHTSIEESNQTEIDTVEEVEELIEPTADSELDNNTDTTVTEPESEDGSTEADTSPESDTPPTQEPAPEEGDE